MDDRHADPGDQDATTEEISVELTPEGVWNCVFVLARDLNRLLNREPFGIAMIGYSPAAMAAGGSGASADALRLPLRAITSLARER